MTDVTDEVAAIIENARQMRLRGDSAARDAAAALERHRPANAAERDAICALLREFGANVAAALVAERYAAMVNEPEVWMQAAEDLRDARQRDAALRAARTAMEMAGNDITMLERLLHLFATIGGNEAACQAAQAVLAQNPRHEHALAVVIRTASSHGERRRHARRLRELAAGDRHKLLSLANDELYAGFRKDAQADFEAALALGETDDASALFGLSNMALAFGRNEVARRLVPRIDGSNDFLPEHWQGLFRRAEENFVPDVMRIAGENMRRLGVREKWLDNIMASLAASDFLPLAPPPAPPAERRGWRRWFGRG